MKKIILLLMVFLGMNQLVIAGEDGNDDKMKLPPSIKYVDKNKDEIVSLEEAIVIFEHYLSNEARTLENDLTEDVESTVIDLISYLEGVSCSDIKRSVAAKRFIEVYYANKFFDLTNAPYPADLKPKLSTTHDTGGIASPTINLYEDFPENIVTDRPDQTEAPQLTPVGFFQIEIGTQTEYDEDKINKVKTQSSLYNTTLWKYGVTKNFELRLITEYAADKMQFKGRSDLPDTTFTMSGFNPIAIGSKIALQKQHGIIPEISLITHLELPFFGSDNYKPINIIPRFRFLFAHTLNDRFTFSYNLGAEWEDGSSVSTEIYTASLGISVCRNLSMFVEAYGFLKENAAADNRLDGGFTYLINNNIQLDCSGGIGLSEISPDYFISAGISVRFNAFNKAMKNKSRSK
ncbi:hypothetical protein CNR22_18845 [Sphingobacteriaceae bacterium]|nr:hypothetical protein CNR22_18845 [Sphingobacteriaceae bacterium]